MSNQSPGGSGSSRKTPSTRLLLRAMLPGSPPELADELRRLRLEVPPPGLPLFYTTGQLGPGTRGRAGPPPPPLPSPPPLHPGSPFRGNWTRQGAKLFKVQALPVLVAAACWILILVTVQALPVMVAKLCAILIAAILFIVAARQPATVPAEPISQFGHTDPGIPAAHSSVLQLSVASNLLSAAFSPDGRRIVMASGRALYRDNIVTIVITPRGCGMPLPAARSLNSR